MVAGIDAINDALVKGHVAVAIANTRTMLSTGNSLEFWSYEAATRAILAHAIAGEGNNLSEIDDIFHQLINQNFGTDNSLHCVIAKQFHPDGVEGDPVREKICRHLDELLTNFQIHSKNSFVSYAVFCGIKENDLGNLSKFAILFHIDDYYLIFSFAKNIERLNRSAMVSFTQSSAGLIFLLQLSAAIRSKPIPETISEDLNSVIKVCVGIKNFLANLERTESSPTPDIMNGLKLAACYQPGPWVEGMNDESFWQGIREKYKPPVLSCDAPPIVRRIGELRIAMCVSGQLRGYDQAFPTWKNFENLGRIDYFIHTWQKIGRNMPSTPRFANRNFSGHFLNAYTDRLRVLGYNSLCSKIPTLINALDRGLTVTKKQLGDFYGTHEVIIEDEDDPFFNGWPNPRKMYYKHHEVLMMPNSWDYDIIIRLRPDKAVVDFGDWSHVVQTMLDSNRQCVLADFTPSFHYWLGLVNGDQLLAGRADLIKKSCDAYREIEHLLASKMYAKNFSDEFLPHVNLTQCMNSKNLEIFTPPVRWADELLNPSLLNPQLVYDSVAVDCANDAAWRDLIHAAETDLKIV